jgi:ribosome biogenesis GTPase
VSEITDSSRSVKAIVRVSYGNRGIAELPGGDQVECTFRRSVGRPLCGDLVQLEKVDGSTLAVTRILPRRNVFVRADQHKLKQPVASNLDVVAIVIAPRPAPSKDLVERYLIAVHSLGIEPLLVINKAELLTAADRSATPPFSRIEDYRHLGYSLIEVSCKAAPGIDALIPQLHQRTSILVGQSGVGKSSLANRLIPDLKLQTGALSRATGKGIHTTTTTIMYTLPDGSRLIDSPGVWEYGLWDMEVGELAAGFPEFAAYQGNCRFNDCCHRGEPGCALADAASDGQIPAWRFESYRRLLAQSS